MKLRVSSLDGFVKECKERKVCEVRVATLYDNVESRPGRHTVHMLATKTVVTAMLDSNSILVCEQSNGTVLDFSGEREELAGRSERAGKAVGEELEKNGFCVKEGMFEL